MRLVLFLMLICSLVFSEEPVVQEIFDPIADLEEEPHAFVHGVNVITGFYMEEALDISLGEVEPLQLRRVYRGGKKRAKQGLMGWEFNHGGSLSNISGGYYDRYQFVDEKGQRVVFERVKKNEPLYPYNVEPGVLSFSEGYMHFPKPGVSAPHPLSMHLIREKHLEDSHVITALGDRYSFEGLLLKKVKRLNGLALHYHYDKKEVSQVDLCNQLGEVTHSLFWKWEGEGLFVRSSQGHWVRYRESKNRLEVSSNRAPTLIYKYEEGRLVRKEGPEGLLLEIVYDEKGRVKKLREQSGTIYRFVYHKSGTHVYDALGGHTLYQYGERRRLDAISHYDENGHLYSKESFDWSLNGSLTSRRFENGEGKVLFERTFEYDKRGNVSSATFGEYSKEYHYSKTHNLIVDEVDARKSSHYVYQEGSNLLIAKYILDGKQIRERHFYSHDENGALTEEMIDDGSREGRKNLEDITERRVTTIKNEKGLPIQIETTFGTLKNKYDAFNQLVEQEHFDMEGNHAFTLTWEYNAFGQVVKEKNAIGQITERVFDSSGRLIKLKEKGKSVTYSYRQGHLFEESVEGFTTQYEYDKRGAKIGSTDCFGNKTAFIFDTFGRLTETKFPDGTIEKCKYNTLGHLIQKIHQDGAETKYERNVRGQPTKITHPDGSMELFFYTPDGLLEKKTTATGNTKEFTYDYLGRCLDDGKDKCQYNSFHLIKKNESLYSYDSLGRLSRCVEGEKESVCEYDALNRCCRILTNGTAKTLHYDLLNRLVEDEILYDYDEAGRKIVEGEIKTAYDMLGRVISLTNKEGTILTTYSGPNSESTNSIGVKTTAIRDCMGRVITLQRGNQEKKMAYDAMGRLIFSQIGEKRVEWQYDLGGHLIFQKDEWGETHYAYNSSGLCEKIIKPDGIELYYTYNDEGKITELRSSDQSVHYRYYYQKENLIRVEDLVHPCQTIREYDRYNRCIKETLGNSLEIARTYDPLDRKLSLTFPDGRTVYYEYEEKKLAKVRWGHFEHTDTQLIGKAGSYSKSREVIESPYWKAHYKYDESGRLIKKNQTRFAYDELDQLTQEGEKQYQYDSLYNRLSQNNDKYDAVGRLIQRGAQTYSYDALDRLIRAGDITYTYDHEGRRLSKNEEIYLYDGPYEISSYKEGKLQNLRILGDGIGGDVGATVAIEIDNQIYAVVNDLSGNIVSLIHAETGELASLIAYTAFGEISIEGITPPWTFSSKRLDPETGFYYFGKRFYDPLHGRWITPDPLGYTAGPNLHAYLLNNPLTHFDREGLFVESIGAFLYDVGYVVGSSLSFIGDHLLPIPYVRDAFSSVGRWFNSWDQRPHTYSHNGDLNKPEVPGARIITINGILNDENQAQAFAENVSQHYGGTNVHYTYNSSHGFVLDLLECLAQKLGFHTHSEEKLIQTIREQCGELGPTGEVHLLAHSQAGLIVNNALTHLSPEYKKMLHIHTFGSACMIHPYNLGEVQNYINRGDFVPWTDPRSLLGGSNIHFINGFGHSAGSYQSVIHDNGKIFSRQFGGRQ